MPTAIEVARFFLRLAAEGIEPEPMTHMRLQKLLYYAQGLSLACRDRPLFSERIEAWTHGPVVPEVYPVFADFSGQPIPLHEALPVALSKEDEEFITSVWDGYGRYSAGELRRMTHGEAPWKDARLGLPDDSPSKCEITLDSMRRFFRDLCDREMRRHSGVSIEELRQGEEDARLGRTVPWEEVEQSLGRRLFD